MSRKMMSKSPREPGPDDYVPGGDLVNHKTRSLRERNTQEYIPGGDPVNH